MSSDGKWRTSMINITSENYEFAFIVVGLAFAIAAVKIARIIVTSKQALLAQRIEHQPSKLGVDGSNPSERAKPIKRRELKPFTIDEA